MGKGRKVPPPRVAVPIYNAQFEETGSIDMGDALGDLVATHRRILKEWYERELFPVDMVTIVTEGLPPPDDTVETTMLWFSALADGVGMVLDYGRDAGRDMEPFEFVVMSELQSEGRARIGRPYTAEELQTNLRTLYERGARINSERRKGTPPAVAE